MSENQIRARAKRHGLALRKSRRTDGYLLVDLRGNFLAAPSSMTLEQVEQWLDDLDATEEV